MNSSLNRQIPLSEFVSPFDGKIYARGKSLGNHVKAYTVRNNVSYEDAITLVLLHNCPDSCKPCEHCNSKMAYLNMSRGLQCSNKECVESRLSKIKEVSTRNISVRIKNAEYEKYVLENKQFYLDNFDKINFIDPFFHRSTKKLSLRAYVARRIVDNNFETSPTWSEERICRFCHTSYVRSYLDRDYNNPNDYCRSYNCRPNITYANYVPINSRLEAFNLFANVFDSLSPSEVNEYLKNNKLHPHHTDDSNYSLINSLISTYNKTNKEILYIYHEGVLFYNFNSLGFNKNYKHIELKSLPADRSFLHDFYYECIICGKISRKTLSDRTKYCSAGCYFKAITGELRYQMYPIFADVGYRLNQSIRMKESIASGKFTPNVTNSWARSKICVTINGVILPCRSSWEAVFAIANPTLLYEKKRIQYTFKDKTHNYIVDFSDEDNKILYEIKPEKMCELGKNLAKFDSLKTYCANTEYSYKIISESWFYEFFKNPDYKLYFTDQPECDKILKRMKQFIL